MLLDLILGIFFLIIISSSIKMATENERLAVFRLGRLINIVGPGLFFLFPVIDKCIRVDLKKYVPNYQTLTKEELFEKIRQIALSLKFV